MSRRNEESMTKTVPEMIVEIQASVDRLESNLVGRLDAASVSVRAKVPFLVLHCREALAWRLADLSEMLSAEPENPTLKRGPAG